MALLEFGSAVANNMALDVTKVQTALEKVKKVGGMELAIEAVAVAGAFEIITKVVDASGRKAPPHHVQRVKQGVLFVMKNRVAIGIVGASVAGAFALSKFTKASF